MKEIIDKLREKRQEEVKQRLNESSEGVFYWDGHSQVPKDVVSVVIERGVTDIGEYAFFNCESLKSVTIPDSVTSISDGVFERCDSLQSINIPNSVTSIGKWAFSHCRSLKSVTIPNLVTKIDERVFAGCESLKSVTIPDSVTSINKYAFSYCTSLKSITIPNSVKFINNGAFYQCDDLKEVILRNPNTKYEEDSFPEHTKIIEGGSNVKESRRVELAKKLLEDEGYKVRGKSLNELVSESDFIDPMRVIISIRPKEDDDYHMQQAMNFFNKNIHTWKLGPEVLVDNSDGTYQLCFPGVNDWINKIKLHCEESIFDIQLENLNESFPENTKIIKKGMKESRRVELAKKLLESKDLEKALDFCKKKGWTPEEGIAYYKKQKDKLESERKKVEAELMKGDGWNSNVGTPRHAYHEKLAGRIYNYIDNRRS